MTRIAGFLNSKMLDKNTILIKRNTAITPNSICYYKMNGRLKQRKWPMKNISPNPRKVKLANGQIGIILIPGLDACLVGLEPKPNENKIWAITEWEYQRRLSLINAKTRKSPSKKNKNHHSLILEQSEPQIEIVSEFRQNPDLNLLPVPKAEILPDYMVETRIVEYIN